MLKYAFCKVCEAEVAVQYKRLETGKGQTVEVLFCPICNKVMNLERWVSPASKDENQGAPAGSSSLIRRLLTWLVCVIPGPVSPKLNRLMLRLTGTYVAHNPFEPTAIRAPPFVDSIVNQLATHSGLTRENGETEEEFMKRAIKGMAEK
jgi:hypothetical protein